MWFSCNRSESILNRELTWYDKQVWGEAGVCWGCVIASSKVKICNSAPAQQNQPQRSVSLPGRGRGEGGGADNCRDGKVKVAGI